MLINNNLLIKKKELLGVVSKQEFLHVSNLKIYNELIEKRFLYDEKNDPIYILKAKKNNGIKKFNLLFIVLTILNLR